MNPVLPAHVSVTRFGKTVMAVTAVALTAAACSSSTTTGSGSGGSSGKAAIVIGGTSDLSAQFSANGRGLQAGLQIAVDAINKQGGINGHQLKLTFLDDAAQVSRGVANGTQLVNQANARVIAGFLLSNVCKAVQPMAEAKKTPMLCNAADATQLGNPPNPNVFLNGILQQRETQSMFAVAGKVVSTANPKVALIGLASAAIQQLQTGQKAEAGKRGWAVGANEIVPLTATDLSAQISAISAAKPDVVFANLADATAILLVRGLRAAGITAPIIASDSSTVVTAKTTMDKNFYVLSAYSVGGTAGAGYQTYLDDAKAAGIDPTKPFVIRGYEQGLIIEQALKSCNACSGKNLIDALNKLELDTGGLTASAVAFTPVDHVGISKLYAYHWNASTNAPSLYATDLVTGP
jgi:branched-chain amino acid transport system substrate-binding protein